MRISFDLDDTLILKTVAGPVDDSLPPLQRISIEERLREGTRELMGALVQRGCEIWIYSNSFRGRKELLQWFAACELPVANVVNQQLHDQKREELGLTSLRPGKFPPWFGIDLHVDDSVELEEDARQHGFKVVRVAADDANWVSTVLGAVDTLLERKP
jgi:hypothetical protein